jgi:thioredoxin 1
MASSTVTEKNIDELLANHNILFLDFWASWCEPCKVFSPIFERVSSQHPDLFFGKINTEAEHLLSEDFKIHSIPTLVILKEGTIIYQESGMIPEYALNNIVNNARKIDVSKLSNDDS